MKKLDPVTLNAITKLKDEFDLTLGEKACQHLLSLLNTQALHQGTYVGCRLEIKLMGTPHAETLLSYTDSHETKNNDHQFQLGDFFFFIDRASLPYLKSATIDFNIEADQIVLEVPYAKMSLEDSVSNKLTLTLAKIQALQGKKQTIESEIKGYLVPIGQPVTLPAGTEVFISQAMGTSITLYAEGQLLHLKRSSYPVIGIDPSDLIPDHLQYEDINENFLLDQLKQCYDPEIPVNIVELGLIYQLTLSKIPQSEALFQVQVTMTLTAAGCGMGDIMALDVKNTLENIPFIQQAQVDITFDPPWNQNNVSEAAKLTLGWI